jgi:hypothetical protein
MLISEKQIFQLMVVLANSIQDLTDLQKIGMAVGERSKSNLEGMKGLHREILGQQSEKLIEVKDE